MNIINEIHKKWVFFEGKGFSVKDAIQESYNTGRREGELRDFNAAIDEVLEIVEFNFSELFTNNYKTTEFTTELIRRVEDRLDEEIEKLRRK